jgi:hypothetical protein
MSEKRELDEGGDPTAPPRSPDTEQDADRDPIEDKDLREKVDDAEQGLREQTQGH